MNRLTIISILILSALLVGCTKKASKKWLVANIQIIDQDTGEGIKSEVKLRYRVSGIFGTGPEEYINLGETDDYGNMEIEQSIGRKHIGLELDIYPYGYYYVWQNGEPRKTVSVSAQGSNTKEIKISPIYPFNLSLKNINCTGPTDSVWVDLTDGDWGGVFSRTGCVDTIFNYVPNGSFVATSPTEDIHFISKKNGVIDSGTISPTFIHGQITNVNLEY